MKGRADDIATDMMTMMECSFALSSVTKPAI